MSRLAPLLDIAEEVPPTEVILQSKKSALTEESLQALEAELHPRSNSLPVLPMEARSTVFSATRKRVPAVTLASSYREPQSILHNTKITGGPIQSAFQALASARPSSRELVDSNRSFLLSNPSRYALLERIPRIITTFVTQNWYFLRFFILGLAAIIALAVFPGLIAAALA